MVGITGRVLNPVDYKYYLTDLRTNEVIGTVPFSDVRYSNTLSQPSEFSGHIMINQETKNFGLRDKTTPGRTGLYIVRNGHPVWGGIIWKRNYMAPSRQLDFTAESFESYLYRRFQLWTRTWANTDQLQIAREICLPVMSTIKGTVDNKTSGRRRDRSMYAHEFKTVGEELEQLGNLIDGFDWNVEITRGPNNTFERHLGFYYPERGVTKQATQLSFEYPGSISEVSYVEDAENGATRLWAIGGGDAEEQIWTNAADTSGNWPVLDDSRSYKSVTRMSTLQEHADSDLVRLRSPIEIAEINVRSNIEPFLEEYAPGDWARFVFSDDYFHPPLEMKMRIIGYNVMVAEDGIEQIDVTVNTERQEMEPGEEEETP